MYELFNQSDLEQNVLYSYINEVDSSVKFTPISLTEWELGIVSDKDYWTFSGIKNTSITFEIRSRYLLSIGYHIVTTELINSLTNLLRNKRVIELGCGTGFLVQSLRDKNIDISGVDDSSFRYYKNNFAPNHCINFDFTKLDINEYDALIAAWPNYEDNAINSVISRMKPNQLLFYVGEGYGGCTGNDEFHSILEDESRFKFDSELSELLSNSTLSFYGIHDRWHLYKAIGD
jgi:SAM-dependent methyltransferase